ncbi:hypothetical protein PROFUN_14742 [Planoprotostelium fungivorum]|uniref:AAA+ ATPase domain-containing protein n=1 Tax=Planoprotostelium fungivorum TaxID=1890364 RepID=A0A2P6MXX5_9EUKA|nr:hypothetical protein PROFUN_14742 [Planoprotostelium fungivorum]
MHLPFASLCLLYDLSVYISTQTAYSEYRARKHLQMFCRGLPNRTQEASIQCKHFPNWEVPKLVLLGTIHAQPEELSEPWDDVKMANTEEKREEIVREALSDVNNTKLQAILTNWGRDTAIPAQITPTVAREESLYRIYQVALHNWETRERALHNYSQLGYLCGQSGIGKTTLLEFTQSYCTETVEKKNESKAGFLGSLRGTISVYIDLSNGDAKLAGEQWSDITPSRIYSQVVENRKWCDRENRISSEACTLRKIFTLLGKSVERRPEDWIAMFVLIDECQWVTQKPEELRSLVRALTTATTTNDGSTPVAVEQRIYVIPLAGTVPVSQISTFSTISGFKAKPIAVNMFTAEQAVETATWSLPTDFLDDMPGAKSLISVYGVIPRCLEVMLRSANAVRKETYSAEMWERNIISDLNSLYSPDTVLSSIGDAGVSRQIILLSLTGTPYKDIVSEKVIQDRQPGICCAQLEIPFRLYPIIGKILWQQFETIIADYLRAQVELLRNTFTLKDLFPGAIMHSSCDNITLSSPGYSLSQDKDHVLTKQYPHHYKAPYPPDATGVTLCASGNPCFDIRVDCDAGGEHQMIWVQARHQEDETKRAATVTYKMVEDCYKRITNTQLNPQHKYQPTFYAYITNRAPDPTLGLFQERINSGTYPYYY